MHPAEVVLLVAFDRGQSFMPQDEFMTGTCDVDKILPVGPALQLAAHLRDEQILE